MRFTEFLAYDKRSRSALRRAHGTRESGCQAGVPMGTRCLNGLFGNHALVVATVSFLSLLFAEQSMCGGWTISGYAYCRGSSPGVYLYWSPPSGVSGTVKYYIWRDYQPYDFTGYTQTSYDNIVNLA